LLEVGALVHSNEPESVFSDFLCLDHVVIAKLLNGLLISMITHHQIEDIFDAVPPACERREVHWLSGGAFSEVNVH
jgi:hypothetical protein